jgi:hypothetical protein
MSLVTIWKQTKNRHAGCPRRPRIMNLLSGAMTAFACAIAISGCSDSAAHNVYVSRPIPDSHVFLVPELSGGRAGWCLATSYRTATGGGSECGGLRRSTGPLFAGVGCDEGETNIHVYALTTREVVAVSAYDGTPIPTTTNATLPDGLRAVAVEVLRHHGQPSIQLNCPRLTPLGAKLRPIRGADKHKPLEFTTDDMVCDGGRWTLGYVFRRN